MDATATPEESPRKRLPRFRRAAEPPSFRLTDDDVAIVRLLARHRFLRSTHISALVGRSVDRTNDRLCKLFHAGYIDRPRAQLDYYPTSGSGPMVYALADVGARLLRQCDDSTFGTTEWSRKNRRAGRPFIEHQLEIMDFYVGLELAVRMRPDLVLLPAEDLLADFPKATREERCPVSLRAALNRDRTTYDVGIVPDLIFGLRFPDGSRRCFMVEIDRGTMPITRSDFRQTSFERKVRAYLTAQAEGQHKQRFGWKTFRVLVVTNDDSRLRSMMATTRAARIPLSLGAALFMFANRRTLSFSGPIEHEWLGGEGRSMLLR